MGKLWVSINSKIKTCDKDLADTHQTPSKTYTLAITLATIEPKTDLTTMAIETIKAIETMEETETIQAVETIQVREQKIDSKCRPKNRNKHLPHSKETQITGIIIREDIRCSRK
jgi:hypothetical protein